jgi:hypothetical protein
MLSLKRKSVGLTKPVLCAQSAPASPREGRDGEDLQLEARHVDAHGGGALVVLAHRPQGGAVVAVGDAVGDPMAKMRRTADTM